MVLELHAPEGDTLRALWDSTGPGFLAYVLSFVYVGVYWNNHHHLFQLVDEVSGSVLWGNLHLLFWLSLLPFTTAWMTNSDLARTPTMLYGVNLLLAGAAYVVPEYAIGRLPEMGPRRREAVGAERKGQLSMVLYILSIGLAAWEPTLGMVVLTAVAVMWLIPDRRIERYLATAAKDATADT